MHLCTGSASFAGFGDSTILKRRRSSLERTCSIKACAASLQAPSNHRSCNDDLFSLWFGVSKTGHTFGTFETASREGRKEVGNSERMEVDRIFLIGLVCPTYTSLALIPQSTYDPAPWDGIKSNPCSKSQPPPRVLIRPVTSFFDWIFPQ